MIGSDIVIIFIFVLFFGYFVYRFLTRKERKLKKEIEKKRKHLYWLMEECSHEINVSDLMKAYRENEISAVPKYQGKIIYISDRITRITHVKIEDQFTFETYPIMLIFHRGARVQCRMYEDDDTSLRDLKRDDKIGVYGVINNFSIDVRDERGDVLLTKCIIPPTEVEE